MGGRLEPRRLLITALVISIVLGGGVTGLILLTGGISGSRTRVAQDVTSPARIRVLGFDLPGPPKDLGFTSDPYEGLIDSPVENNVLVSTNSGLSSGEVAQQVQDLLDYYLRQMPNEGWTLVHSYAATDETGDGNPAGTLGGGLSWSKGGHAVLVHVGNYAPWHDWGWRLNVILWKLK